MENESPIAVLARTQLGGRLAEYAQLHHMTSAVLPIDPLTAGVTIANSIVNRSFDELPTFLTTLPRSPAAIAMEKMIGRMQTLPGQGGPEVIDHEGMKSGLVMANVKHALEVQLGNVTSPTVNALKIGGQ